MIADAQTQTFAWQHRHEEVPRLLLGHHEGVDLRVAARQIEGWREARTKWPSLADRADYCFPPRINREQSSSEEAAQYKAEIVGAAGRCADLTGGMGIDTAALASVAEYVDYVEQSAPLTDLARYNFGILGLHNIACHAAEALGWLEQQPGLFDLLYLDPARRDAQGRKVAAFDDCQPSLLPSLGLLRSRCRRMLVKASPMIDIPLATAQLGNVEQVHVLSLRNECKEVLFLCGQQGREPEIICVDQSPQGRNRHSFLPSAERQASCRFASQMARYLYEPHAALMKGGCFSLLSQWLGVDKLDRNSHLYTSDRLVQFPGRTFEVEAAVSLSSKQLRAVLPGMTAHVMVRNYPVGAALLQQQLHIKEGGDKYLVATTLAGRKAAFLCRRIA